MAHAGGGVKGGGGQRRLISRTVRVPHPEG